MSLAGLLVTVRITVTYARPRYLPHSLRHPAITYIAAACVAGDAR